MAAQHLLRWAAFARPAFLLLTLLTVGLLLAGSPRLYADLHTVCVTDCPAPDWQPTVDGLDQLTASGISLDAYAAVVLGLQVLSAAVWLALATLLVSRGREHRMALLAAVFLVSVGAELSGALLDAAVRAFPDLSVPATGVRVLGDICLGTFFLLVPDGRFVPKWTGWLSLAWVVTEVPTELWPGTWADSNTWPTPLFILAIPGYFALVLATQIWRYRRSSPLQRQQMKVVVYGFVIGLGGQNLLLAVATLTMRDSVAVGSPMFVAFMIATRLMLLLIPLSLAVAISRYRLWDIDVLINRTLVYVTLSACVVGVYVAVVGYLGMVFRSESSPLPSFVAAALIAIMFQPLRLWLQHAVNRLLYGRRDEPYAVLTRLGQRLETTLAPEAALTAIVQDVREALRVPYVAIVLPARGVVAAAGAHTPDAQRVGLTYQQSQIGELLVAPRAPGEIFGAADMRLLLELARQAGAVVHAQALTADLQQARERLVAAREEERRRLRRDLHDGLGPRLASQALTIDAARALMQRDHSAAETLLLEVKTQAQAAVADIRRIVEGLRPPALDEIGLVGALRASCASYARGGLEVEIQSDAPLPDMPAAVEVAAFRIVQEALTNVVRHASARHACVRLTLDRSAHQLALEVADDGVGFSGTPNGSGVGLSSMRERAEELGGACIIDAVPGGGTRVRAWLPLEQV